MVLFLILNAGYSQSYQQQRVEVFGYNVLLNGFIGGIGGAINKSREEKVFRAFGKNFLKGALGGVIIYGAKYSVYELRDSDKFWLAPILRAGYYLGYSFTYNASLNKSLFDSYHCQFYMFNLDVQLKEKFNVLPRLSVLSVLSVGSLFALGDKLDLENSLKYGLFYFNQNRKYENIRDGLGLNNAIEVISKDQENYSEEFRNSTIAHEMIHTFQFPDYFSISNCIRSSFSMIKSKGFYTSLSKYVYLEGPYFPLLYITQPVPYYKNFYEFEAYHFETRERYVAN